MSDDETRLGREAARRFAPRRASAVQIEPRALAVHAERRGIGTLARSTRRFVESTGRSLAARRMLDAPVPYRAGSTLGLPARLPMLDAALVAMQDRARSQISMSRAEVVMRTMLDARRRAAGLVSRAASELPPRGLPRAIDRRTRSPKGEATGPAAAPLRMVSEPAFVSNPPDVRGAGVMLTPDEVERSVPVRYAEPRNEANRGSGRALGSGGPVFAPLPGAAPRTGFVRRSPLLARASRTNPAPMVSAPVPASAPTVRLPSPGARPAVAPTLHTPAGRAAAATATALPTPAGRAASATATATATALAPEHQPALLSRVTRASATQVGGDAARGSVLALPIAMRRTASSSTSTAPRPAAVVRRSPLLTRASRTNPAPMVAAPVSALALRMPSSTVAPALRTTAGRATAAAAAVAIDHPTAVAEAHHLARRADAPRTPTHQPASPWQPSGAKGTQVDVPGSAGEPRRTPTHQPASLWQPSGAKGTQVDVFGRAGEARGSVLALPIAMSRPLDGAATAPTVVERIAARARAVAARMSERVQRVTGAPVTLPGAMTQVATARATADARRPAFPAATRGGAPRGAFAAAGSATEAVVPESTARAIAATPGASRRRQFLRALAPNVAVPVQAFPARLAPLVRTIAGDKPVYVRSDPAVRRALASVRRPAATIGNVVHLAAPAEHVAPQVVAHEIAHASRPTPVPRFFGDVADDEERRANTLSRAVTAPVERAASFRAGTTGLPVAAGAAIALSAPASAGRSASGRSPSGAARNPAAASPTASAGRSGGIVERSAPLFAAAAASASGSQVIRRAFDAGASGADYDAPSAQIHGSSPNVIRREPEPAPAAVTKSPASTTSGLSSSDIDRIVAALERRVLAELERRGRRHRPGVF